MTEAPSSSSTSVPEKKVEEKKSVVGGTSSVEVESRLAASADDMWAFLTDEKRVPAWTRAPAKVSVVDNALQDSERLLTLLNNHAARHPSA